MKILTFIAYYLPGYKSGGPVRTISNLVNLLHKEHEFKIITKNRDQLENKPYQGIKTNEWNKYEKCEIFYTDGKKNLREIINSTDFDIYYLNSFFDYKFSIKILLLLKLGHIPRKPALLAPRGEFSKGALSLKGFKKTLFIKISKILQLHKNIIWHASSKYEVEEISREYGDSVNIRIAMDVPDFSLAQTAEERKRDPAQGGTGGETERKKEKGKLKILYLSRIAQIKNLLFVIDVLNEVKGDFTLDIYGPITDKRYWEKCLNHINIRIKERVKYMGSIPNDRLHEVYPKYDLLFFPTLSENFGHVIFESLSCGCPVLISDQTPWDKVEYYKAGRSLNVKHKESFIKQIEKIILLDNKEFNPYKEGCFNYMRELKESGTYVIENQRLFEKNL